MKMRGFSIKTRILAFVFFCYLPIWDIIPFYIVLNYMCSDKNEFLNQKPIPVRGFLSFDHRHGCGYSCASRFLIENNYDFVEIKVDYPASKTLTPSPGYYKIFLTNSGDVDCKYYNDILSIKDFRQGKLAPYGFCYGSKKILNLESDYSFEVVKNKNNNNMRTIRKYFGIERTDYIVKKISNNEVKLNIVLLRYSAAIKWVRDGLDFVRDYGYCPGEIAHFDLEGYYKKIIPSQRSYDMR